MRSATLLLLVLVAACGRGSADTEPPNIAAQAPPASVQVDAAAKAKEVFAQRCVPCHGTTGNGDGPASASLTPKPRAFGDPQWQASVSDEHIKMIIMRGGVAVGKSAAMPNNPDLTDPAVLGELASIVRAFKK